MKLNCKNIAADFDNSLKLLASIPKFIPDPLVIVDRYFQFEFYNMQGLRLIYDMGGKQETKLPQQYEHLVNKALLSNEAQSIEITDPEGKILAINFIPMVKDSSVLIQAKDITILKKLADIDELTKVFSLRLFNHDLENAVERIKRSGDNLAVYMIDANCLKIINDTYGHPVGDEYLIKISQACNNGLRDADKFYRIGGDEFAAICEDIGDGAEEVAKRIVEKLNAGHIYTPKKEIIKLSAAIGYYVFRPNSKTIKNISVADIIASLKDYSDKAMYEAKNINNHHKNTRYFEYIETQI